MHLDPSTADGLLYASRKDGGLGLGKLAAHIPVQLQWIKWLLDSNDDLT